jgi:hypothetical protein
MHILDFIILFVICAYTFIFGYSALQIKKGDNCKVLKSIFVFSFGYLILIGTMMLALPVVLFS